MSLPAGWVDSLFARLAIRYGDKWQRMYPEIDMRAVKTDWADVLGGCSGESISYALVNLPLDWPPNAMQFRQLCSAKPESDTPLLPAPRDPMPANVAAKFAEVAARHEPEDPKEWAYRLKAREMQRDRLTLAQRQMWREAVRWLSVESDLRAGAISQEIEA